MMTSLPFNRKFIASLVAFPALFCVFALVPSIAGSASTSTTYCAAPDGDPDASGNCWDDPLDLSTALRLAQPGDEVWVQQGRYAPGEDEHSSFYLPDGVSVYGGYTGNPDSPAERDPNPANTVLDGEDRSYTVVIAAGIQDATLNGVTITNGSATLIDNEAIDVQRRGGGIYVSNASVTFQNLMIANNRARFGGGGVYVDEGSTTVLRNITFQGNSATHPQSGRGGGMRIRAGETTLNDVTFRSNDAVRGGGLFVDGGDVSIRNSLFAENEASQGGGGISVYSGNLEVINTRLVFNEAEQEGGGIYVSRAGISVLLDQVDLTGNRAAEGGGGALVQSTSVEISRSIIAGNEAAIGSGGGLALAHTSGTLTSNTVQGNRSLLGGAIAVHNTDAIVLNSLITGNAATTPEDPAQPARSIGDEAERESMISDPWRQIITGELFPSNYLLDEVDYPAENAGGALLITGRGSTSVISSTIAGNRGGALGAAIYRVGNNTAEVLNSIIYDILPLTAEIAPEHGAIVFSDVEEDSTTRLHLDHTLIQGGCPLQHGIVCRNTLDDDPRFLDPVDPADAPTQSGDFSLWFTSPALDAADPSYLPPEIDRDLHDNDRLVRQLSEPRLPAFDSVLDLGALETQIETSLRHHMTLNFQNNSISARVDASADENGRVTGTVEIETENWRFLEVMPGRMYSAENGIVILDGEALLHDGRLTGFIIEAEMSQLHSGIRHFRIRLDTGESSTWYQVIGND